MSKLSAALCRDLVRTYTRNFPIARGKRLVMETLAPLYATDREEICELPGGAKIRVDLREHVQRFVYFFGAYEVETVAWFRSVLRPGMTFLDIGSHVGQYTLIAASQVGPTGRVHAFEPNPVSFNRLQQNLTLNQFSRVTAHPVAVSNATGPTTLYVPQSDNLGEASLQACVDDTTARTIESVKLDTWVETADLGTPARVDFIKIDVQGFETRVVESAASMLRTFRPIVICEFEERWLRMAGSSSTELKQRFVDLGYQVKRTTPAGLGPVGLDEVHAFENLVLVPVERGAELNRS